MENDFSEDLASGDYKAPVDLNDNLIVWHLAIVVTWQFPGF